MSSASCWSRAVRRLGLMLVGLLLVSGCSASQDAEEARAVSPEEREEGELVRSYDQIPIEPAEPTVVKSEEEWREILTEEQYHILREHGTERAFTGELLENDAEGVYICAGCGHELFSSEAKYDSRTGWPSYYEPIGEGAVGTAEDRSLGMYRVEVHCGQCAGHLGHVFPDGPEPTGLRYCINSLAMEFSPAH